jgi:DNA helicase II / ATP-dependent DNA helicase PcrA
MATGTLAEIEEERRLLYVAMTRAKDSLHLIAPLRFYTHGQVKRGDRHVYATRCRFLPEHVLCEFEVRSCTSPRAADARTAPLARRDLRAQILARYF